MSSQQGPVLVAAIAPGLADFVDGTDGMFDLGPVFDCLGEHGLRHCVALQNVSAKSPQFTFCFSIGAIE
jgi:hypothetical protein